MGRELLDKNVESVRWEIAHKFAQWTTRAAVQSQGTTNRFPSKQKEVNSYLDAVAFDHLFDKSLGSIDNDQFDEWHAEQVNKLQDCHSNINVGWAAKMIAVYLKTTCYLAGFGRDGLDAVIHPPFDNILMTKMGKYIHQFNIRNKQLRNYDAELYDFTLLVSEEMLNDLSNIRIKDIDDDSYWEMLIPTCENVAANLGCTLFEVEQLWTIE